MKRSSIIRTTAIGIAVLAVGGAAVASASSNDTKRRPRVEAALTTPDGAELGTVRFKDTKDGTEVRVRLREMPENIARDAFHGFHIHANSDPANGDGCIADPAQPSNTWYVSADGHYTEPGAVHSNHKGDMPSPIVSPDGSVEMRFTLSRVTAGELLGKAVVLHAKPDNFGNVPVGGGADQYTPNSPEATTKTEATGNASDRLACGLIEKD
jgi:superoxide dismutase, Cu-Zn family